MPTYDYECSRCGSRFEIFQKMTDAPIASCPKCGGKAERLIGSGSAIIFKGRGFYETDYKKNKKTDSQKPCPAANAEACKGCPLQKA